MNFKDMSFVDHMAENGPYSKNVILTVKHTPDTYWAGLAKAETTSREILELSPPRNTLAQWLEEVLKEKVRG